MDDPNILIAASAATGAIIGAVLTAALRGPRTVYVPIYTGGSMSPLRVEVERRPRRRPEDYDPRAHLPKDIDNRPKLGSMTDAYEAERKQLLQARQQMPETDESD